MRIIYPLAFENENVCKAINSLAFENEKAIQFWPEGNAIAQCSKRSMEYKNVLSRPGREGYVTCIGKLSYCNKN